MVGGSGRSGSVDVVLLQCQVSRLMDRPPGGLSVIPSPVPVENDGGRHGALRQHVRGGRDQSEGATTPNRGTGLEVMTCTICARREAGVAHVASMRAGKQRM